MEEMVEQTILTSGRKDLDLLEEILAWHGLVKEQKKKKVLLDKVELQSWCHLSSGR